MLPDRLSVRRKGRTTHLAVRALARRMFRWISRSVLRRSLRRLISSVRTRSSRACSIPMDRNPAQVATHPTRRSSARADSALVLPRNSQALAGMVLVDSRAGTRAPPTTAATTTDRSMAIAAAKAAMARAVTRATREVTRATRAVTTNSSARDRRVPVMATRARFAMFPGTGSRTAPSMLRRVARPAYRAAEHRASRWAVSLEETAGMTGGSTVASRVPVRFPRDMCARSAACLATGSRTAPRSSRARLRSTVGTDSSAGDLTPHPVMADSHSTCRRRAGTRPCLRRTLRPCLPMATFARSARSPVTLFTSAPTTARVTRRTTGNVALMATDSAATFERFRLC
eukprot:Opistho-2@68497